MTFPRAYIAPLISAFLLLCYLAGYFICTETTYCNSVGKRLYLLGMLGFMFMPIAGVIQLAMASIKHFRSDPGYRPLAIAGVLGFLLLIILIVLGESGIYLAEKI